MGTCLSFLLAMSIHLGFEDQFNPIHPHVKCTTNNYITGVYYNSSNNISVYIGKEFRTGPNHSVELALVTGYVNTITPMVRYKMDKLFISPGMDDKGNAGIVMGVELKF